MSKPIRAEIKQLIAAINPFDEQELLHIKDALNWIDSDNEIFRIARPDIPPKHLVVFTVFFDPVLKKILLIELKKAALLLLPNGGHLEKDELPYITALREVKEEMGEDAEFLFDAKVPLFLDQAVTVGATAGHTDVTLWYILKRDSIVPINDKSAEFQREMGNYYWFTLPEILSLDIKKLNPNMHRFVNKLQNLI